MNAYSVRNDNQILHGDQTGGGGFLQYRPRMPTRDLLAVANFLVSCGMRINSVFNALN